MTESGPDGRRPTRPQVVFEDPDYRAGRVDLLGAVAYGELSAFERLAEDAKLAPDAARQGRDGGDGERWSSATSRGCTTGSASSAPTRSRRWRRSSAPIDLFHAHTAPVGLVRGADQGLRRRRAGRRLLPRDRGVPRRRDPRPDHRLAGGRRPGRLRRRPDPAGDRGRPAARRPAGAVGPAADGGGADPGPAGGRRARRADRPAGRRRSTGPGLDLAAIGRMFTRITERHTERMAEIGLSA